jgi:DNA-binding NtrC family response regulator
MPQMPEILLVGFDQKVAQNLSKTLELSGVVCLVSCPPSRIGPLLSEEEITVVMCPEEDLGNVLTETNASGTRIPVVVVSRTDDRDRYLKAMCAGAFDYIVYPAHRREVEWILKNAIEMRGATRPTARPATTAKA